MNICTDCTDEQICADCLAVWQEQESNYLEGLGV